MLFPQCERRTFLLAYKQNLSREEARYQSPDTTIHWRVTMEIALTLFHCCKITLSRCLPLMLLIEGLGNTAIG
jgi:hypothetical protein